MPGARPTKHISMKIQNALVSNIYATDHNDILYTSRKWHCRDVYKILLWSAAYILH